MLTDDNFTAIVHAVEEGRIIFEDLRRIVFYLVTDGVCVIPLGMEPKNRNVLSDPPIDPKSGIFNFKFLRRILILAPVMTAGTLGLFPGCSSAGMRRRREP